MEKISAVAVFDFDETIVLENSLGLLFSYVVGSRAYVFKALPAIVAYIKKPGSFYDLRKLIKRRLYHACLLNQPANNLIHAGSFAAKKLTLNPRVVELLKRHAESKDFLLIATASPWQYVQSILESLDIPFNKVIGTELASSSDDGHKEGDIEEGDRVLTGSLVGEECSRDHKWQRIEACFKELNIGDCPVVAYGNRPDDVQMLEQVNTGYVVSGRNITLFK